MNSLDGAAKLEVQVNRPLNIRNIFSKCSEMYELRDPKLAWFKTDHRFGIKSPEIYPCNSTTRSSSKHYFIKFKDKPSLERALKLVDKPGIHIYSITQKPHLIDEYKAASRFSYGTSNYSSPSTSYIPNKRDLEKRREAYPRRNSNLHATASHYTPQPNLDRSPLLVHRDPSFKPKLSEPRFSQISTHVPSPSYKAKDHADDSLDVAPPGPLMLPRTFHRSTTSDVSSNPPSQTIATRPLSSSNTQLPLKLCGKEILYDLKTLDSDARPIIDLLKTTDSECGSWMMVGAYYRRIGNAEAAISVINSMIEGMTQCGISENDLKPAFLLLAACETNLAKRTTGQQTEHYKNSIMWLQKVYGCNSPTVLAPSQNDTKVLEKIISPHPENRSPIESPGDIKPITSERDIKILQDRSNHWQQSELLKEVRSAKRRLEEDLRSERYVRRRLQHDLDIAKKELRIAQRTESHALQQIKREVEARRRAEETAKAEKTLRLDLMKHSSARIDDRNPSRTTTPFPKFK